MFHKITSLHIAIAAILLCQGLIAASAIFTLTHAIRDPLSIVSSHITKQEIPYGEMIELHLVYERAAYCKASLDRFLFKKPEMTLVRRERLPAGSTKIGTEEMIALIPTKFPSQVVLPFGIGDISVQDLFPGNNYLLRQFVHSDCGDRNHTAIAPDIEFSITLPQ
jgi:hypothetical protein